MRGGVGGDGEGGVAGVGSMPCEKVVRGGGGAGVPGPPFVSPVIYICGESVARFSRATAQPMH